MAKGGVRTLTQRQREYLVCARDGLSYVETAQKLGVRLETVRQTYQAVYQKLDARDRTQAVVKAIKFGLIPLG